ncbi:probable tRNA (uracil-O(2)-)-methyltransferase isoform X1 [Conger conger]|uniref:probable tRNA (uracil-O(2)-)-methyltransferase isoform X1 n=1 Tax=Conger conger TaxID=82655 RepID=UPI002A5A3C4F|nr:probable tRNA (uracil-O(2)-)-methyltransferase isoform X1 [Conger conger]
MSKLSVFKFKGSYDLLPQGFWSAIDVWIHKPHVLNKRLCGVKVEESREVDYLEVESILSTIWDNATEDANNVLSYLNVSTESNTQIHANRKGQWCFGVRTIVPKVNTYGAQLHKEIILKDASRQCVVFLPFEENEEGHTIPKQSNIYRIQLQAEDSEEWSVSVSALQPDDWFSDGVVYPKFPWLTGVLLPKLAQWSIETRQSEFKSTLSLIPVEKYSCMYQRLKEKYKEMVKVWPEVTDPEKFVYEDVAIATYLLVLWEEERAEKGLTAKQSFVDLGCGNGLLVHILSNEGHPGKGIDVRKRKIWDMYGVQTRLEERAITPSDSFLFPDTDWLIGNHSDELTPWIPVIASRSSYACRFFVLPCCFYDFCGKYQRRQCRKSQYKEYIDFISEVSTACGFSVEEDCLRIPSTKRVCLIGKTRNYEPSGEAQEDERRTQYIQARLSRSAAPLGEPRGEGAPAETGGGWGEGFQPREKIQITRNCASLPRNFIDGVVLRVGRTLLGLNPEDAHDKDAWNPGGSLSVREVAEMLDKETLQTLKKECGGLQTLLKNNHQVFRVEKGRVQIRDWRAAGAEGGSCAPPKRRPVESMEKTRPCWFHTHHPQGCPLPSERCLFAHGPHDLRPAPPPRKRHKSQIPPAAPEDHGKA